MTETSTASYISCADAESTVKINSEGQRHRQEPVGGAGLSGLTSLIHNKFRSIKHLPYRAANWLELGLHPLCIAPVQWGIRIHRPIFYYYINRRNKSFKGKLLVVCDIGLQIKYVLLLCTVGGADQVYFLTGLIHKHLHSIKHLPYGLIFGLYSLYIALQVQWNLSIYSARKTRKQFVRFKDIQLDLVVYNTLINYLLLFYILLKLSSHT